MLRRFGNVVTLLALVLVQVPMIALTAVMLLLAFALGMVFLFPPQVMMVRELAELNRRLVRDWTGIDIEPPTCPRPCPRCRRPTGCTAPSARSIGRPAFRPGTTGGSGWSAIRRRGATRSGCCSTRW
ncbi:hypothetical protein ACFQYP_52425 [Nonomuraea antimicrobica]